jgi:AbrB family looped-hinge helix DNA binding protein
LGETNINAYLWGSQMRTRVTSEGELMVPSELVERLGLHPGDEVDLIERDDGVLIGRHRRQSAFDRWVGFLKGTDSRTPDEIVSDLRAK